MRHFSFNSSSIHQPKTIDRADDGEQVELATNRRNESLSNRPHEKKNGSAPKANKSISLALTVPLSRANRRRLREENETRSKRTAEQVDRRVKKAQNKISEYDLVVPNACVDC